MLHFVNNVTPSSPPPPLPPFTTIVLSSSVSNISYHPFIFYSKIGPLKNK